MKLSVVNYVLKLLTICQCNRTAKTQMVVRNGCLEPKQGNIFKHLCIRNILIQNTVLPWYSLASELVKPGIAHFGKENVSAFGTSLPLVSLAGTCMSHTTICKRKCFVNRLLLVTHQNELMTSTEVALY